MKIELGKTYLDESGREISITQRLLRDERGKHVYKGETEDYTNWYEEDGAQYYRIPNTDLIKEIRKMNDKAKSDKVNTGLTLIPWYSILEIGKIFIEGLRYGRDNWKKGVHDKEYQEERLEYAMLHLIKWKEGDRSEEHLAKVAWFCVTQLELERLERQPVPVEQSPLPTTKWEDL